MRYITNYFIYSSLIYLFIEWALFISILTHEFGHAIPALLFTEGKVCVYVGSHGDSTHSVKFSIGRLYCFIKYNPLIWFNGFCSSDNIKSRNKNIIRIAGGPCASISLTIIALYTYIPMQWQNVGKWCVGTVVLVSLQHVISSCIPRKKVIKTHSGKTIYNDARQIINLLKTKPLEKNSDKAT